MRAQVYIPCEDEFWAWVDITRKSLNISNTKFCNLAGVSPNVLSKKGRVSLCVAHKLVEAAHSLAREKDVQLVAFCRLSDADAFIENAE
jgi:hypothetical protein